ncbi:hypothetical protein Tco_1044166 [Tanacetum coccineum]|uniref:Uncharacterized protein n=1 Tax=Tanacetum coccineum TaxID=301880 RepID=A0ABQ5GQD1_9ASTR
MFMVIRLLRYAKSRPKESYLQLIMYGPYVRSMIPEPGDAVREKSGYVCIQMLKGSGYWDFKKKKAKLFMIGIRGFTYTDGESIESYFHRFLQIDE